MLFVDTNPNYNMRIDQYISLSCNSFSWFLRAKTAMEVNNKRRTLPLFNNLLRQGSRREVLHQGWYLRYLVTESTPSSAKFPVAVVDLDRSYPEYRHLFPKCQKYWSTLKYAYFNILISRYVWLNIMQNLSLVNRTRVRRKGREGRVR